MEQETHQWTLDYQTQLPISFDEVIFWKSFNIQIGKHTHKITFRDRKKPFYITYIRNLKYNANKSIYETDSQNFWICPQKQRQQK